MTGERTETLSQASAWDQVRGHARRFGLCERCSAQMAWAVQQHSGGFAAAHPPCESCGLLLLRLPLERANGWRTVQGAASDVRNWPLGPTGDVPRHPVPAGAVVGSESRFLRRSASVDEQLREREGGV